MFYPVVESNGSPYLMANSLTSTQVGSISRPTGLPTLPIAGVSGSTTFAYGLVDSEIILFLLSASGGCQINSPGRALFGTTGAAHTSGTPVYFLMTPTDLDNYSTERFNKFYGGTTLNPDKKGMMYLPYQIGSATGQAPYMLWNTGSAWQQIGPVSCYLPGSIAAWTKQNFMNARATFVTANTYWNLQSIGVASSGDNICTIDGSFSAGGWYLGTKLHAAWEMKTCSTRRSCGLYYSNGTRHFCFAIDTSAGYARLSVLDYTNRTTFGSVLMSPIDVSEIAMTYMRIRYRFVDGTNDFYDCEISADGMHWVIVYSQSKVGYFTVTTWGYFLNPAEANSPISMTIAHHYQGT